MYVFKYRATKIFVRKKRRLIAVQTGNNKIIGRFFLRIFFVLYLKNFFSIGHI